MIIGIVQGLLYLCLLIFTLTAVIHIHYERSETNVDIPQAYKLRTEEVFPVRSFHSPSGKRSFTKNRLTESKSDAIFGRSCSSTETMPGLTPIVLSETGDLQKFDFNVAGQKPRMRCLHQCKCRKCINLLYTIDNEAEM